MPKVARKATQSFVLERAYQGQEFAEEAGGARQPDIAESEHHESDRIERHALHETAVGTDLVSVHAAIDNTNAKEQRTRDQAMADHLVNSALDPLGVSGRKSPIVTKPM